VTSQAEGEARYTLWEGLVSLSASRTQSTICAWEKPSGRSSALI
jgi:hypothetical protein